MPEYFESESFVEPHQAKNHVANILKNSKRVKSLTFETKGESLKDAKEFSKKLILLKRKGVRVSHEFLLKLDFPKGVSRDHILDLIENMPKPINGEAKVKVELRAHEN